MVEQKAKERKKPASSSVASAESGLSALFRQLFGQDDRDRTASSSSSKTKAKHKQVVCTVGLGGGGCAGWPLFQSEQTGGKELANSVYLCWSDATNQLLALTAPPTNSSSNTLLTNTNKRVATVLNLPTNPPFDVNVLLANGSGSLLVLYGADGALIVELAAHFLDGRFPSASSYMCRSNMVDWRAFSSNVKLRCLKCRWHPNDSHLLMLCSNNTIGVYDGALPTEALLKLTFDAGPISGGTGDCVYSQSASVFGCRERLVSFDVVQRQDGDEDGCCVDVDLFGVTSSGEVHSACLNLAQRSYKTRGGLAMYPADECDTGASAVDMALVKGAYGRSTTLLLLLYMNDGTLFVCVVLETKRGNKNTCDKTALALLSSKKGNRKLFGESCESDLSNISDTSVEAAGSAVHILEAVELAAPSAGGFVLADLGQLSSQVYCSSPTDLYGVDLSAVFVSLGAAGESDPLLFQQNRVVVEHLLHSPAGLRAVFPLHASRPVFGVGAVGALLNTGSLFHWQTPIDFLLKTTPCAKSGKGAAAADDADGIGRRESAGDDVVLDQIRRLLHRDRTQPFVSSLTELEKRDHSLAAELLSRSMVILQEEYIDKLVKAKQTVDKSVASLVVQRAEQTKELVKLDEKCRAYLDKLALVEEKIIRADSEQLVLKRRLANVTNRLGSTSGPLTAEEERLVAKLENFRQQLVEIAEKVDRLYVDFKSVEKTRRLDVFGRIKAIGESSNQRSAQKLILQRNETRLDQIQATISRIVVDN